MVQAAQSSWHSTAVDLFSAQLRQHGRPRYLAQHQMALALGRRQMPVPDVVTVTAASYHRLEPDRYYYAEDVLLAVKVSEPETLLRDRRWKPRIYAEAGIPHFWRVERSADGGAAVYTFERAPATGQYVAVGIHHGRLAAAVPFPMDFGIAAGDIAR